VAGLDRNRWFAAAKSASLLTQAIALVAQSPTDPRTLTRAALDHGQTHPQFALDAALAALHWMAQGKGYDITAADVQEAFQAALAASRNAGRSDQQTVAEVRALLAGSGAAQQRLAKMLVRELAG
jgi:hypothetical protein